MKRWRETAAEFVEMDNRDLARAIPSMWRMKLAWMVLGRRGTFALLEMYHRHMRPEEQGNG